MNNLSIHRKSCLPSLVREILKMLNDSNIMPKVKKKANFSIKNAQTETLLVSDATRRGRGYVLLRKDLIRLRGAQAILCIMILNIKFKIIYTELLVASLPPSGVSWICVNTMVYLYYANTYTYLSIFINKKQITRHNIQRSRFLLHNPSTYIPTYLPNSR